MTIITSLWNCLATNPARGKLARARHRERRAGIFATTRHGLARARGAAIGYGALFALIAAALVVFASEQANARIDNALDPSGVWENDQGSLSLMLAGEALYFSYSSVFGPTAHICDGAGVARLVGSGSYHHADDSGAIAIVATETELRMRPVSGVPSFCGANWPGEKFKRASHKPVEQERVTSAKAYFYRVMPSPPSRSNAYVIADDRVETVPTQHSQARDYALARFIGPTVTTAGLLKRSRLARTD